MCVWGGEIKERRKLGCARDFIAIINLIISESTTEHTMFESSPKGQLSAQREQGGQKP